MPIARISLPTPFPVGAVNAYLVQGDALTLIDCGPLDEETWASLCEGVSAAGHAVEKVRALVLTHPHHDHAGLARRVQQVSGCTVFAHPVDRALLLGHPREWEAVADFLIEGCRRAGVPEESLREQREGLARFSRFVEPLEAVAPLDEGDRLPGGRGAFSVLHTPGHARGALSFWDPGEGTLVSGDTLIPHISSNAVLEPGPGGRFRLKSLSLYLETLRRLAELGARKVLPGHGEPMGSPAELIRRRLAFHESRARRIRRLVTEGAERPWEIARHLFPGLEPTAVFLAVSEVVGHLDLLAERGEVRFEGEEGPWRALPPAAERRQPVDPAHPGEGGCCGG